MSISLVAALGNPGREYADTRHNLGWVVVDALARQQGLRWQHQPKFEAEIARWDRPGGPCYLAKPFTFMNASGRSVATLARYYKLTPEAVAVVHDEFTIELGLVKVSTTGSAGGHNGVASVLSHLGEGFVRYRLGIGPKDPPQMDIKDFVLGKFSPAQQSVISHHLDHYLNGLSLLIDSGAERAMINLNRRDKNESDQA